MLKNIKLLAIFILILSFCSIVFGQKMAVLPGNPKALILSSDYKVLAEGSNSRVDQPFVFVARDAGSYGQLRGLVEGLPPASSINFKQQAVVAGFAGTRPTGGWTVQIKQSGERVGIFIQGPSKDMMVTQVITTPFKVALVPVAEDQPLPLNLAPDFINKMRVFQVNKGNFEFSGGITGSRTQFKADGTIRLLTFGDYASVWFDLKGKGRDLKRKLLEMTSGTLKNGNLELKRLDTGSFVELPRPPFSVKGNLKNKNLSLNFEPLPTNVADGFEGKGSLTAVRIK